MPSLEPTICSRIPVDWRIQQSGLNRFEVLHALYLFGISGVQENNQRRTCCGLQRNHWGTSGFIAAVVLSCRKAQYYPSTIEMCKTPSVPNDPEVFKSDINLVSLGQRINSPPFSTSFRSPRPGHLIKSGHLSGSVEADGGQIFHQPQRFHIDAPGQFFFCHEEGGGPQEELSYGETGERQGRTSRAAPDRKPPPPRPPRAVAGGRRTDNAERTAWKHIRDPLRLSECEQQLLLTALTLPFGAQCCMPLDATIPEFGFSGVMWSCQGNAEGSLSP
ncbi:hypothetical protein BJV74DRAFT_796290 [Russula compacta]|nr:hypothetical protein BJV74DRAFT_796290 [Russula compacta]